MLFWRVWASSICPLIYYMHENRSSVVHFECQYVVTPIHTLQLYRLYNVQEHWRVWCRFSIQNELDGFVNSLAIWYSLWIGRNPRKLSRMKNDPYNQSKCIPTIMRIHNFDYIWFNFKMLCWYYAIFFMWNFSCWLSVFVHFGFYVLITRLLLLTL